MRAILVPATLAALLAAAPLAMAAQTSTGHVKSFDAKSNVLTLRNGVVYNLPADFKNPGIKSGSKVQISWDMRDGKHEASKVMVVK